MPFTIEKLAIPDALLIQSKKFSDDRGFFFETFKQSEFSALGLPIFVQDNFSHSKKGVLRGLHYQLAPSTQGKLVACLSGRIFDVAVDIRKSSPTFGTWVGMELSEENSKLLYVPPGFAHGFVALEDDTRVLYKCTAEYNPQAERGVCWDDPQLAITWPFRDVVLNDRDQSFPELKDAEIFA